MQGKEGIVRKPRLAPGFAETWSTRSLSKWHSGRTLLEVLKKARSNSARESLPISDKPLDMLQASRATKGRATRWTLKSA